MEILNASSHGIIAIREKLLPLSRRKYPADYLHITFINNQEVPVGRVEFLEASPLSVWRKLAEYSVYAAKAS